MGVGNSKKKILVGFSFFVLFAATVIRLIFILIF
jgi:hypothetical protein